MALENIFSEFKEGNVRIWLPTMKASVIDVVQLVTKKGKDYASQIVRNVLHNHPETADRIQRFKFPGERQRITPIADAATLIEIIFLLPGVMAQQFRHKCALYICRLLGGDESLIPEIRTQAEVVDQSHLQSFFLQPVRDVDLADWQQKRVLARDGNKSKTAAIRDSLPTATHLEYARNNGLINKSIMGVSKRDLKQKLALAKHFVVRNYMTTSQLALVRPAEDASAGIYRTHSVDAAVRNQHLTEVYDMISRLSDYSDLKRKCLATPLRITAPAESAPKRRRIRTPGDDRQTATTIEQFLQKNTADAAATFHHPPFVKNESSFS